MNVSPINNINYANNTFKSCFRKYPQKNLTTNNFNGFALPYIYNSTNIFREDIDWANLIKYILCHFADKKQVKSYSLASSDGSEAYTYAISIMEKIPESAFDKFFPIIASDVDKTIVRLANKRLINLFNSEFYYTNKVYNIDLNNYFYKIGNTPVTIPNDNISDIQDIGLYEPIEALKKNVLFKQSDILTELKNLKDEGNSIIMCRNVLPYLSQEYIKNIAETVKNSLKPGSLFITGDFDKRCNIDELLEKNGFFKPLINQNNVFQRGDVNDLIKKLYSGYLC